jgi:hypothetical protein
MYIREISAIIASLIEINSMTIKDFKYSDFQEEMVHSHLHSSAPRYPVHSLYSSLEIEKQSILRLGLDIRIIIGLY